MRTRLTPRVASALTAGFTLAKGAFAQSCIMCYTSAAAGRDGAIRALRNGILILLLPPLLIFIGICVAAFRKREEE